MAIIENGGASPVAQQSDKRGFWQRLKEGILRTEKEIAFAKGLVVVSIIGTLIGAAFQNLSAYDDKVTAQAKDDLSAATQTLTDTSTALSAAVTLQQLLISNFYAAVDSKVYQDNSAYLTSSSQAIYNEYVSTYTSLQHNYNLLARKAEIFLDWPSDFTHDAAANTTASVDPINMSTLGEFDFDCEKYMPNFEPGKTRVKLTDSHDGSVVYLDWNSAKHHVLTIQYCFEVTHKKITAILEWAAKNTIDPAEWSYITNADQRALFNKTRATYQVLRLNDFVSRAMSQIELIRVKYRPNGYFCSVPIMSGLIGFLSQRLSGNQQNWCTPIRSSAL